MAVPAGFLGAVPQVLRDALTQCYEEIINNYREGRWEPAELNGGKICEVVYTIVNGAIVGTYPNAPSKPPKMLDACKSLEMTPSNPSRIGDRSLRILIPRLLPVLYEIRNNRNVGHVGGDVDPNHADAEFVVSSSSWLMAELVRIFHNIPLTDAQAIVDELIDRNIPVVWKHKNTRRVLKAGLSAKKQVLLLLYGEPEVSETDLRNWVEYNNASMFRSKVLHTLHGDRLIEFDSKARMATITPLGKEEVERMLREFRKST